MRILVECCIFVLPRNHNRINTFSFVLYQQNFVSKYARPFLKIPLFCCYVEDTHKFLNFYELAPNEFSDDNKNFKVLREVCLHCLLLIFQTLSILLLT